MPSLLRPQKGRYKLVNYEKVLCINTDCEIDIFKARGNDQHNGCVVVVRPDQHVAQVLPLGAFDKLIALFDAFKIAQR